jgi:hypothetical protein
MNGKIIRKDTGSRKIFNYHVLSIDLERFGKDNTEYYALPLSIVGRFDRAIKALRTLSSQRNDSHSWLGACIGRIQDLISGGRRLPAERSAKWVWFQLLRVPSGAESIGFMVDHGQFLDERSAEKRSQ